MRIDRMLGITIILLGREKVTARELAQRFEVSLRTIYRDLDAIQQAGIPVVCLSGSGGGYSLMENYTVDRRLLNFKDMAAILSALRGVRNIASTLDGSPGLLESTFEKISSLVPQDKAQEMEQHLERLVIDYLPWDTSPKQTAQFRMISQSIANNELLTLTYRNLRGTTNTRVIEPMTLLFKGYTWYLFAYCRMQNDFRIFRLSRILKLEATGQPFQRREGSYRSIWDSYQPASPPVKLVLAFAPEARSRAEEYFGVDELSDYSDGRLLAQVSWPEDEWVYTFLLSFGEHIEVLEPPHIRKLLCDKAAQIYNVHKNK
ncbi:MAG TPA: YafY family transcriptional regulator [Firmicutes bacterium]|nr:YafY family transcriptional regulator [Bacillota bacterium]